MTRRPAIDSVAVVERRILAAGHRLADLPRQPVNSLDVESTERGDEARSCAQDDEPRAERGRVRRVTSPGPFAAVWARVTSPGPFAAVWRGLGRPWRLLTAATVSTVLGPATGVGAGPQSLLAGLTVVSAVAMVTVSVIHSTDAGGTGLEAPVRRARTDVVVAGVIAVLAAWSGAWTIWHEGELPTSALVVAGAFVVAGGLTIDAVDDLANTWLDHRRRRHRRVLLELVTCRIDGCEGRILDLSVSGARVWIPGPSPVGPMPSLWFRLPLDGVWSELTVAGRVVRRDNDPSGATVLGVEFRDPTDPSLAAVRALLSGSGAGRSVAGL